MATKREVLTETLAAQLTKIDELRAPYIAAKQELIVILKDMAKRLEADVKELETQGV